MESKLVGAIADSIRSVSKPTQTMVITRDSLFVEDLSLDSLDLVGVLMKLEDEFGLTIELDDVPNLKTVGDLASHLNQLTGGQSAAA